MRDICFRAWHKIDNSTVDWKELCHNGFGSYAQNFFNRCDLILMQYTGLSDKNGVEIWESDKVNISVVGEIPYEAVIVFKDGGFRCSHYGHIIPNKSHEIEVIGNIYEKE